MAKFLVLLALCQFAPGILSKYNPLDYPGPLDLVNLQPDDPTPQVPFQPRPSLEDLKHYAQFTGASYELYNEEDAARWDCQACIKTGPSVTLHKLLINGVANTLGLINIDSSRKEIIVTYRGALNVQNLFLDVLFLPASLKFPGFNGRVKVHAGFLAAANSLFQRTVTELRDLLTQNPDYSVVFVGHSTGSAMTVLNAFNTRALPGFEDVKFTVIGYGQPRIGNRAWADYVNSQSNVTIARVSNSADLFTHMQARGLQSWFIHSSNEVWIRKDRSVKEDCRTDIYEDPECSISVGPAYNIWDHMQGYFDTHYFMDWMENFCDVLNQFFLHFPSIGIDPCKKP